MDSAESRSGGRPERQTFGSRDALAAELRALKAASSYSYQALAREIDRPVSTLHGWISARHLPYPRDNEDFVALVSLLGASDPHYLLSSVVALRSGTTAAPENPYKGLDPFTEADAARFFGRESLTRSLLETVLTAAGEVGHPPVVVIGASGSGKTSLLRAGLLSALEARQEGWSLTYNTAFADDGDPPFSGLETTANSATPRLVVIDQFEQCFGPEHEERLGAVVEWMEALCIQPNTALAIGIRSDFFHRAVEVPLLLRGIEDHAVIVGSMTLEGVTRAIMQPAAGSSVEIEPDLLTELVHEFVERGQRVASSTSLPLLSHVLCEMVDQSDDARLTLARYRSAGGLASAIERSAETAFAASGANGAACRSLFAQLVDVGPGSHVTRRVCQLSALQGSAPVVDFEAIVAEFAAHRLLTTDFDTVTISHEALLHAWPRLAGWIDDGKALLLVANRVRSAATTWRQTDKNRDVLLRGSQLEAAEELMGSDRAATLLSADDREFVRASEDAQNERERRRREVMSRSLATQARLLWHDDRSLSAQIAVLAYRAAPTVEARSALLGATSPPPVGRLLGSAGPTVMAVSTTAGVVALSGAADASVRVVRSGQAGFEEVAVVAGEPRPMPRSLAVSPDGTFVAVEAVEGIELIELGSTTRVVAVPSAGEVSSGPVHALHLGSCGRLFAAGTDTVACWRLAGDLEAKLEWALPSDSATVALATDQAGTLLAMGQRDGTVSLLAPDRPDAPVWSHTTEGSGPAAAVALSPTGDTLAAGFHNGWVRAWSVDSDTFALSEIDLDGPPFGSWVNALSFADDGATLAAASSDGNVRLWGTETWDRTLTDLVHPTVVTEVGFLHPDTLVTAAEDGALRVWDVSSRLTLRSNKSIWSISHDRSGRLRGYASRDLAELWSVAPGEAAKLAQELWPGDDGDFSGASAVSPDGDRFAVGARNGAVLVVAVDGGEVTRLDGLSSLVENIAFSPDGSLLAGVDQSGRVQVWMVEVSGPIRRGGTVDVEPPAMSPAFSADSKLLAVTSESGHVTLVDVETPESPVVRSRFVAGDSFALGAAFHPVEPVLAVGNADRSTSLWDCAAPEQPRLVTRLTGPAGHTIAVAFNSTGNRLAAGTTDGVAWLWDTTNLSKPNVVARLASLARGVYTLAFTPDGRSLVAAGPRHRLFTWTLDEEVAMEEIRNAVGDPMTAEEWEYHLPNLPYDPSFLA